MRSTAIIGGGLAGCECAAHMARAGLPVTLFEQKPSVFSPAHVSDTLAELVCSNSFRSDDMESGIGLLKQEMRELGSLIIEAADKNNIPAGKALAVNREDFSAYVTKRVEDDPRINLVRRTINSLDDPDLSGFDNIVVAAGPLVGDSLSASLAEIVGSEHLYFYDAIAPIIWADSVNMEIAFWGSRYGADDEPGDYLNCPLEYDEYHAFHAALLGAQKVAVKNFEKERHFEACMPIETLAERDERTLAFGPLKPVGFVNPRTGRRPYALLQLRPENRNRDMFNLVGCQTKLTYLEQDRVFRMIPGLEQARFAKYGSMHRNTYVNAPQALDDGLALKNMPHVRIAGQIAGVEGYVESAACGLWVVMLLSLRERGRDLPRPPITTALGGLLWHLSRPVKNFQPSNVNFGLMPEIGGHVRKKERRRLYSERARADFALWKQNSGSSLIE